MNRLRWWQEVDEGLSHKERKVLPCCARRANQFLEGTRKFSKRFPAPKNLAVRAFRSKIEMPKILGNRYKTKHASKLIYWEQLQQQRIWLQHQFLIFKTFTLNQAKIPTWRAAPRVSSRLTNPISTILATSQSRLGILDSQDSCLLSQDAEGLYLKKMSLKLLEKNLNQKLPMGSPLEKEI